MSNEWFNSGEVPPVGTECEAIFKPITKFVLKCIILDDKSIAYKVGKEWKTTFILQDTTFRPVRTQKEKAIDAALSVMQTKSISNAQRKTINRLYEAGLLRSPEDAL